VDWVEFHNDGTLSVDMTGWTLTDTLGSAQGYIFPGPWVINAGEYRSLRATVFSPQNYPNGFRFSSLGEQAYLLSAGTSVACDTMVFPASRNGWSFIRYTGTDGRTNVVSSYTSTEAGPNSYPLAGANQGVVITEINFSPAPASVPWVKFTNISPIQFELFDPTFVNDTYQISGLYNNSDPPNGFFLPQNILLQPQESFYVTNVDATTFRTARSLPAGTKVYQVPNWALGTSGLIKLWAPDVPNFNNVSQIIGVPYYLRDSVAYQVGRGLPSDTDGTGNYLIKIADVSYGNDYVKWRSSSTPAPLCLSGNATDCPYMDACTVSACSPTDKCVYSLRQCINIQSDAQAAAYNACFPPVGGGTGCQYTTPLPLTPSTASSTLPSIACFAFALVTIVAAIGK